jgi:tetratricopeptide (TPR) repeat protein
VVSHEEARPDQLPIDFGPPGPSARILPFLRRTPPSAPADQHPADADGWCARGAELEPEDPAQAHEAYRRALALDRDHAEANVNLGRMLHEAGHVRAAEMHYRRALRTNPDHPTALFNLGVALEDLGSPREAARVYEQALGADPGNADAHFNLARLHERAGRKAAAIRHLKAYRELIGGKVG